MEDRRSVHWPQFHDDEAPGFGFADVVDSDDVGMIEGGCSLRLLLEAANPFFILGELIGQQFERDFAHQTRIFGQVNLTHSAFAELPNDSIMREGFAKHSALGVIPPSSNHR